MDFLGGKTVRNCLYNRWREMTKLTKWKILFGKTEKNNL